MKVALTGSTGLIGRQLAARLLQDGREVRVLVRREADPAKGEIRWDPAVGVVEDPSSGPGLDGLDAVIHLAGESIAGRWTAARKAAIRESRVRGTSLLAEVLAALPHPPKVFLSASAVGFYGDRGGEELTEESQAGGGFLPDTCREWEAACGPARQAGIRVVNLRTGIVLSPRGGALAKMLFPFKMGLGGRVGAGEQWMSWISLEDEVGAILYALENPRISGPLNLAAPNPLTNAAFTKVLGKVLGRPTLFPLPSFMVKLLFGEMGQALLLEGQRVLPRKLEASGFKFRHQDLEQALRHALAG